MNAVEAGKLLAFLSAVDNREVDAVRAQGWAFALDDIPFEVGQSALRDALHGMDGAYVTPQVLRKHAGPYLRKIARDVRSAKARRWVPESWPAEKPLPEEVAERLRLEFEATNDYPDEISAAAAGGPAAIGAVGRSVG